MTGRAGSTLVEVLVAILVLELALVGVAGMAAVAGRTLADAVRLERAAGAVGEVVDSLALAAAVESGVRPIRGGWIRWSAADPAAHGLRTLRVAAVDSAGDPLFEVRTLVAAGSVEDRTAIP